MGFSMWFKTFAVMSVISTWATKALDDGKVTAAEGISLVMQLAEVLGLPMESGADDMNKKMAKAIKTAKDSETTKTDVG